METKLTTAEIAGIAANVRGEAKAKGAASKAKAIRSLEIALEKKGAAKSLPAILAAETQGAALSIAAEAVSPKTAAQPAKPKAKPAASGAGKRTNWKQVEADAREGKMPTPPDFSAETHKRFRGKLDEIVAAAKAGDVPALKGFNINPVSSSPRAMDRYRRCAILAIEAVAK